MLQAFIEKSVSCISNCESMMTSASSPQVYAVLTNPSNLYQHKSELLALINLNNE